MDKEYIIEKLNKWYGVKNWEYYESPNSLSFIQGMTIGGCNKIQYTMMRTMSWDLILDLTAELTLAISIFFLNEEERLRNNAKREI